MFKKKVSGQKSRWYFAQKRISCVAILIFFTLGNMVFASNFNVELSEDGKSAIIKRYVGKDSVVVVPSTIEGLPVKEIGNSAFDMASVSKITLPTTLEVIGNRAFSSCRNLASIIIPNSVRIIGEFAFEGCVNLPSIVIPNSVKTICNGAFRNTPALRSVKFPTTKIEIGGSAFFESGLKELTITGNMKFGNFSNGVTVGYSTRFFGACDNIEAIVIEANVEELPHSFLSSDILKTIVFKGEVTGIEDDTFYNCPNLSLASQAAIKQHIKKNNPAYLKIEHSKYLTEAEELILKELEEKLLCKSFDIKNTKLKALKDEAIENSVNSGKILKIKIEDYNGDEIDYYAFPEKYPSLLEDIEASIVEYGQKAEFTIKDTFLRDHPLKYTALKNTLKSGKIIEFSMKYDGNVYYSTPEYYADKQKEIKQREEEENKARKQREEEAQKEIKQLEDEIKKAKSKEKKAKAGKFLKNLF